MFARNSDLYFDVSASCVGLFFQRLARLLDFRVLALDLLVLVREQPRLLLQLLVRLLQLLLAALQLLASDCDCLSRSSVRMFASIVLMHDADRFGQLVEERLVRRVEALERRELEHAAHLAFEDDRQHEHVRPRRARRGPR